jgi:hypothetical protein
VVAAGVRSTIATATVATTTTIAAVATLTTATIATTAVIPPVVLLGLFAGFYRVGVCAEKRVSHRRDIMREQPLAKVWAY